MKEETVDDYLFDLKIKIREAKECGIKQKILAQRIEDDLKRIMNSGYLNLCDSIEAYKELSELKRGGSNETH